MYLRIYQFLFILLNDNNTAEKGDKPEKKIERYMDRLERVHEKAKESPHKMEVLKKFYYDKYVIKELPESYINLQKKIYKETGYGNIEITNPMKEEMLQVIQEDQKESLKEWIT